MANKTRKKDSKREAEPAATSGSAGRLIVTYLDGSWTDKLALQRYVFEPEPGELVVSLEVSARERSGKRGAGRQALKDFITKIGRVHTIQIGKPALGEQLRNHTRALEHSRVAVQLKAQGSTVNYPADLAFGPDEVTLNLG